MDLVKLNKKLFLLIGLPTLICQMKLTRLSWVNLISSEDLKTETSQEEI
jgi:hypothetical protein